MSAFIYSLSKKTSKHCSTFTTSVSLHYCVTKLFHAFQCQKRNMKKWWRKMEYWAQPLWIIVVPDYWSQISNSRNSKHKYISKYPITGSNKTSISIEPKSDHSLLISVSNTLTANSLMLLRLDLYACRTHKNVFSAYPMSWEVGLKKFIGLFGIAQILLDLFWKSRLNIFVSIEPI